MAAPTVHLVASAGPGEGRGHVARLVTLAEALAETDAFVSTELLRGELTPGERERLAAAGADTVASGRPPDAVVVDIPQPDEIAGRWDPGRLAVFDDSHRLTSDAAIVVQPSLPAWTGRARVGTVLAGYRFAPIRESLRRLAATGVRPAEPPEVLICFGGGDPFDVTARVGVVVAEAARGAGVTVVVGAGYRGAVEAGGVPGVAVLRDPADIDERLARATVAVLGAGMMKLEAAHLGTPAVLVAVADDQPAVGEPFGTTGAAVYAGDGRTIEPASVGDELSRLLADPGRRASMSAAGRRTVDGRGAERIAAAVVALARGESSPGIR